MTALLARADAPSLLLAPRLLLPGDSMLTGTGGARGAAAGTAALGAAITDLACNGKTRGGNAGNSDG